MIRLYQEKIRQYKAEIESKKANYSQNKKLIVYKKTTKHYLLGLMNNTIKDLLGSQISQKIKPFFNFDSITLSLMFCLSIEAWVGGYYRPLYLNLGLVIIRENTLSKLIEKFSISLKRLSLIILSVVSVVFLFLLSFNSSILGDTLLIVYRKFVYSALIEPNGIQPILFVIKPWNENFQKLIIDSGILELLSKKGFSLLILSIFKVKYSDLYFKLAERENKSKSCCIPAWFRVSNMWHKQEFLGN